MKFRREMVVPPIALVGLVGAPGCHKVEQAQPDAAEVADGGVAVAPEEGDADVVAAGEVAPPEAVVAEDPSIPLNEAVVGAAPVPADYSAAIAPPAPVVEDRPAPPETDDVWTPGYWWWSQPLDRYVWVTGAWRHPPPDQVWSLGSWNLFGGRYFWTPGYWGPRGYARIYIDQLPPPIRVEVRPAPPAVGFVWTPGFYAWRGGSYAWVGGSWMRPPAVGVSWVEPRYVTIGSRYTLQPGRWDFPPERRGIAYRPDINVRPGGRCTIAPMPREVVVAHANFVVAASRVLARGGVRTPNGGFAVEKAPPHGGPSGVVIREEPHPVPDEHRGVVNEHHGAPPVIVQQHGEPAPHRGPVEHGAPPSGHGGHPRERR